MSRLIWILIGSIGMAALCWFFWGRDVEVPFLGEKPEEIVGPIELPVTRQLTNAEGKTLDVRILRKSDGNLEVERQSDDQKFTIPILNLSEEDQAFASHIVEVKVEPPFIVARQKEISELQKKSLKLSQEITSGELSRMIHQQRLKEYNDVTREIKSLEKDITDYRWKNKLD